MIEGRKILRKKQREAYRKRLEARQVEMMNLWLSQANKSLEDLKKQLETIK
jgi:hypothetical protein